jgi:O-acetyl-ADP-ribose deacetylase (regulator of RNase III)
MDEKSGPKTTLPGGKTLRLMVGDITRVQADAIVNAANSGLRGGGGVDGAIHRAGGPAIMKELDGIRRERGGCPTGEAVATGAGNLPARYVFHAVGPIYRGRRDEPDLLASCYRVSMRMASERGVRTIAFPSISTGAYGYPLEEAAGIAIAAVRESLSEPANTVEDAVFVLFDQRTCDAYARALDEAG